MDIATEGRPQTVQDLVTLLVGIRSRTSLYEDIRLGRIRTVRLGRRYLVPASEVRRLMGED